MRALWRYATSIKVSALLMAVLALLFLLNVALPQARLLGPEAVAAIAQDSAIKRFVLIHLGFGDMPSSPIFMTAMALFFVNLTAVLIDRASATARRIRAKTPSAVKLRRRAQSKDAVRLPRPAGWDDQRAEEILVRLGYRVSRPDEGLLSADKNRRALLGFIVFHLSFFPLLAGGLMLYYTRHESQALIVEGQRYNPAAAKLIRASPLGDAPELDFTVTEVSPRFEGGHPTQLVANMQLVEDGRPVSRTAMINHPVRLRDIDILVDQVGLAPALRVSDAQGRTLDFLAAPAPLNSGGVLPMPLTAEGLELEIEPVAVDASYGNRERLATTPISLSLLQSGALLHFGTLRPGEFAQAGAYTIKLEEVRFWVRVRIIRERGGWVLIFGFALGVVGLVWRMLFVRRELGLAWTDDEIVLFGSSEFYQGRFREDLDALGAVVVEEASPSKGADS